MWKHALEQERDNKRKVLTHFLLILKISLHDCERGKKPLAKIGVMFESLFPYVTCIFFSKGNHCMVAALGTLFCHPSYLFSKFKVFRSKFIVEFYVSI
jgi:hypothetical protein